MRLRWKNTEEKYQDLYDKAYMRFERSMNNAVSKTRSFEFIVYASENHTHRPAIGKFKLLFTNFSAETTIFTDGVKEFKFNSTYDNYLDLDGNSYLPNGPLQVIELGFPGYNEVGYFIDELGDEIKFKREFGEQWLLSQEFDGFPLGQNWEIIK